MPKFRVSGDVRHAFVTEVEADSQEEAIEMVEGMNHNDLDDVQTGSSGTAIEVQDSELIEEEEAA
jgi:hypothetical protein